MRTRSLRQLTAVAALALTTIATAAACTAAPVSPWLRRMPRSDMEPTVTLRAITERNRQEIVDLRVAAERQDFVDGVRESIAAATPHASPWYRAVYAGEVPVGFVMLADDVLPGNEVIPWRYYLWRMLIDARFQGRGYGRTALDCVVAYLRTRPGADTLVTSVVAGEGSPMGFYLRYGFQSTGQMFDHEHVLLLRLKDVPAPRSLSTCSNRPE